MVRLPYMQSSHWRHAEDAATKRVSPKNHGGALRRLFQVKKGEQKKFVPQERFVSHIFNIAPFSFVANFNVRTDCTRAAKTKQDMLRPQTGS